MVETSHPVQDFEQFDSLYPNRYYPAYQREIDYQHVDKICEGIREYFQEFNTQCSLGTIYMCRYPVDHLDSKQVAYDIVDGQHRLEAIFALKDDFHLRFQVAVIDVVNSHQAEKQYLLFNRSKNHSETLDIVHGDNKKQLMDQCRQWLTKTYPNVFTIDKTAKRPRIRVDGFIDSFVKSEYYNGVSTLDDFISIFRDYNNYLASADILPLLVNAYLAVHTSGKNTVHTIKSNRIYFALLNNDSYFTPVSD